MISKSKVMNLSQVLWITGSVTFWWGSLSAQLLPPASEDVKLRVTQQELDEDAAGRSEKAQAEALARQFKVEPSAVENLRNSKQGWGEIGIRLGLAQGLTKADPKTYPTIAKALQKVGDLRTQKMGWDAIANELGLALGPVISEVQRVRQEMRVEAKRAATEGVVTPERALERSQTEQASQSDRADKTQRPKRTEKLQRP